MKETYILMHGRTQLGILNSYEQSFPWIYCNFTAHAVFEAMRPLFEAELKSTESQEVWEQAYDAIEALDL